MRNAGLDEVQAGIKIAGRNINNLIYADDTTLFFHLFLLVRGYLLYNIIVVFAIHWHESAMDLLVFPY